MCGNVKHLAEASVKLGHLCLGNWGIRLSDLSERLMSLMGISTCQSIRVMSSTIRR
jgi:hypothetical protein